MATINHLTTIQFDVGAVRPLAGISDVALLEHCHATNPRRDTREDYLAMLEAAYRG